MLWPAAALSSPFCSCQHEYLDAVQWAGSGNWPSWKWAQHEIEFISLWFCSLVQLGEPQRWQDGERKGRKSSEGNTRGGGRCVCDPDPLPSSSLAGRAEKCLSLWGRTSFRPYASKSLGRKNSGGKFIFYITAPNPVKANFREVPRQEEEGWWWAGLQWTVGPTNACWHRGYSSTPPQHGGQPAAHVNTQRDPRSSAVVLNPKHSAHPCSTSLGQCRIHCKTTHPVTRTIKTRLSPLDEVP